MQDKELDNLFRSKLDNFETEPSANLWRNIDTGLQAGKRKRISVPLLSAAASIIVLVTAGVLLIPNHVKHTNGRLVKSGLVKSDGHVKLPVKAPANKIAQVALVVTTIRTNPVKQTIALQPVKKQLIVVQSQTNNSSAGRHPAAINQPATTQPPQQVIASVSQKPDVTAQPKQNDTALLAVNTVIAPGRQPAHAVVPDKPIIAAAIVQPTKKHRIHSLGDMLNTVIAAVDKRKDKLIEFTDTDDDESVITGVNLGIVAVKKQN